MMMMKNSADQDGSKKLLFIANLATFSYLGLVGFAVYLSPKVCGVAEAKVSGVISKWFGCLPLNELGDFFAGAFAPLAFIWLAVAVFIQKEFQGSVTGHVIHIYPIKIYSVKS